MNMEYEIDDVINTPDDDTDIDPVEMYAPDNLQAAQGKYYADLSRFHKEAEKCESIENFFELKARHREQIVGGRIVPKPYRPGIDPDPPDLPFSISHDGVPLVPQGGLCVITGSTGTTKSYVSAGILVYLENNEADTFGFSLNIPEDKKALIIDTEMQPRALLMRYKALCRRAGVEKLTRIEMMACRGWELIDIQVLLEQELSNKKNGIIILDCITDFLSDFNNVDESQKLIHRLMKAGNDGITIICTIHDNPLSSKSAVGGKSRGHLGTMLPQRADAAFLIERDSNTGICKLTNDFLFGKSRNAAFGGVTQFFQWSDELKMPVSINDSDYKLAVVDRELRYVRELLSVREKWTTSELLEHLMITEKIKDNAAKKRIATLKKSGILVQINRGFYAVNGSLVSEEMGFNTSID